MRKLFLIITVSLAFVFLTSFQSFAQCEGDFDCDGDVDGSDLATFAADFGRTDCEDSGLYYTKTEVNALVADLQSQINEIQASGNVSSITAGGGLTGSASTGDVTLAVDFDNLITDTGILIESTDNGVSIVTGFAQIIIDPLGNISIKSYGDLTLKTIGGDLNLTSDRSLNISAAQDLNISSGANMVVTTGADSLVNIGADKITTIGRDNAVQIGGDSAVQAHGNISFAADLDTIIMSGNDTLINSRHTMLDSLEIYISSRIKTKLESSGGIFIKASNLVLP